MRADAAPCYGASPCIGIQGEANGNYLPFETPTSDASERVQRSVSFQNGTHLCWLLSTGKLWMESLQQKTKKDRRYCEKQTVDRCARRELTPECEINGKSSNR